jgi:DNA-binding GntR family transcriptional regulator
MNSPLAAPAALRRRQRPGAAGEVAAYLRDAISAGHLRPGERLDLASLATKLEVSRTPVREALVQLESEGLLETLSSRATIVVRLSMRRVEELFAARIPIEGTLADVGARRLSDDDLERLQEIHHRMRPLRTVDDTDELLALHSRFITTIYEAADSDRLLSIARPMIVLGENLRRQFGFSSAEQMRWFSARYADLLDAAVTRDGRRCRQAMRLQLVDAAASVLSLERSPDDIEFLPAVLTADEWRTFRTTAATPQRWARRIET